MLGMALAAASLALAARSSAAPPAAPSALERFQAEMEGLSAETEPRSLEPLFELAGEAIKEIGPRMEGLNRGGLARMRKRAPGLLFLDRELYAVAIDAKFWVDLAGRLGTETDRSFFALFWKTRPGNLRPDYMRDLGARRACLDFGPGRMVALYGDWGRWRARHPGAYESEAAAQEAAVARDLLEETCACGDEEGVVAEYEWFLRALPGSKLAGRVREKLKALREGRSGMRFRCLSG